jgi:uncharacterized membrane protein YgcG
MINQQIILLFYRFLIAEVV